MAPDVLTGLPRRNAEVWLRQSDAENAIYNPTTDEVHLLNATAMAIWTLCDGSTTPEEMIQAVVGLSGLPRDVVEEDVLRILRQFEHAGILSWDG